MDGYDVARALRANELLNGTSLVALSGYALPEDLQRAAQAGFNRHLAKPPNLAKLEGLLAKLPTGGSQLSQSGALLSVHTCCLTREHVLAITHSASTTRSLPLAFGAIQRCVRAAE